MPLSTLRRRVRSIPFIAVAALAMAFPATVAADTEMGHSGLTGTHRLRDAAGYPGARCGYYNEKTFFLAEIRVRPPVMFARNSTSGLDIRTVAWRAVLQDRNGTSWTTIASKAFQKEQATDLHPADFLGQRFTDLSGDGPYRILVDMRWYGADGSVIGNARHRVDHYGRFDMVTGAAYSAVTGACAA